VSRPEALLLKSLAIKRGIACSARLEELIQAAATVEGITVSDEHVEAEKNRPKKRQGWNSRKPKARDEIGEMEAFIKFHEQIKDFR
jgi:hypothetical protein